MNFEILLIIGSDIPYSINCYLRSSKSFNGFDVFGFCFSQVIETFRLLKLVMMAQIWSAYLSHLCNGDPLRGSLDKNLRISRTRKVSLPEKPAHSGDLSERLFQNLLPKFKRTIDYLSFKVISI
jgi:hypothetical protein